MCQFFLKKGIDPLETLSQAWHRKSLPLTFLLCALPPNVRSCFSQRVSSFFDVSKKLAPRWETSAAHVTCLLAFQKSGQ